MKPRAVEIKQDEIPDQSTKQYTGTQFRDQISRI